MTTECEGEGVLPGREKTPKEVTYIRIATIHKSISQCHYSPSWRGNQRGRKISLFLHAFVLYKHITIIKCQYPGN
jgi:hypothetical protein